MDVDNYDVLGFRVSKCPSNLDTVFVYFTNTCKRYAWSQADGPDTFPMTLSDSNCQ